MSIILLSAQPDQPRFIWELYCQHFNFWRHGLANSAVSLVGTFSRPSQMALDLQATVPGHVLFYPITLTKQETAWYNPIQRPHLLKQFFKQYGSQDVFYHDSDVIIIEKPDFASLLKDDLHYCSDTVSYIGAKYVDECSRRYAVWNETERRWGTRCDGPVREDFVDLICRVMDADPQLFRQRNADSGGAQYLIKGMGYHFWANVEKKATPLFRAMHEANRRLFPEVMDKRQQQDLGIQAWCTDMWQVLLELQRRGGDFRITPELEFQWATDSYTHTRTDRPRPKLFHNAGIGEGDPKRFAKGEYKTRFPFNDNFDRIDRSSGSWRYVEELIATKKHFNL